MISIPGATGGSTYEMGGPLLQEGLSPTVRSYSRISMTWNLIPPLPCSDSLDPYVAARLSLVVRCLMMPLTRTAREGRLLGTDADRFGRALDTLGAVLRRFRSDLAASFLFPPLLNMVIKKALFLLGCREQKKE